MTSRDDTTATRGPGAAYRLKRYVTKYGLKAAVTRAIGAARDRVVMDETHIWYEMPTGKELPTLVLEPGLTLIKADDTMLPLIEKLPTISLAEARQRRAAGADLWLVLDEADGKPVYGGWIFGPSMPVASAKGGVLRLPPGTVTVEDSVTAPAKRGRGIMPAAVRRLWETHVGEGASTLLTKIREDNVPSRKAAAKIGFQEIGSMRFRQIGPWRRTTMSGGIGPRGSWLQSELSR